MAKQLIDIRFKIEYNPDENNNKPARIFLFQLINRLNYMHKIKEIEYKGKKLIVENEDDIRNLPLRKIDKIK